MARKKKPKPIELIEIKIEGGARISTTDSRRVVVILSDAESMGIISVGKILLHPDLLPADYEPLDYDVNGSYSLNLSLTKKK